MNFVDKRIHPRFQLQVPIKYKFINRNISQSSPKIEQIYDGVTTNISEGGLLFVITLPELEWVTELLLQKMILGVNLILEEGPIKALCRTCWIGNISVLSETYRATIGLEFKEINYEDREKIKRNLNVNGFI
ncbi:MAG: PilZ domain-containing protein [Planctomycetota bacterium]